MKLYEKARKMKKAFCFDICPFLSQEKCVHVWFEFFPNYLSRKKEPRKHFSASALPRPRKFFPWFLFPTSAKIGKNSNQTWTNFSRDKTGQISKQNTIFSYEIFFSSYGKNCSNFLRWKCNNKKIFCHLMNIEKTRTNEKNEHVSRISIFSPTEVQAYTIYISLILKSSKFY